MILDLSCTSSTRGPTTQTHHALRRGTRALLTGAVLAALLSACGATGADGGASGAPSPGDAEREAANAAAASIEAEPEVPAAELEAAEPVAPDAPEVQRIEAVLEAQEVFVPSEEPAGDPAGTNAGGDAGAADAAADAAAAAVELDPQAVAAAEEVADGAALQEVIASLTEYEHQGWRQEGSPTVVGEPVMAPLDAEGAEAVRVTVCLDSSDVTVVDRDGVVVSGPQKGRRALHNYDLIRQPGQAWQVVQHGFPADPAC